MIELNLCLVKKGTLCAALNTCKPDDTVDRAGAEAHRSLWDKAHAEWSPVNGFHTIRIDETELRVLRDCVGELYSRLDWLTDRLP